VWPVIADGNAPDEYPLRVWHERNRLSNANYSAIVPCTWPPAEDEANAIRIGKGLIRDKGNRVRSVTITAGDLEGSPPDDGG
jgi:hypothetical protein